MRTSSESPKVVLVERKYSWTKEPLKSAGPLFFHA
jgi:hypothetical protein